MYVVVYEHVLLLTDISDVNSANKPRADASDGDTKASPATPAHKRKASGSVHM
jgi:hypothetical protein